MRTFQVKNLFLIFLLLTVLLAACSKREVTGSSEAMSASAVSVSAESVVSSVSSDVQITSELAATSSKESAAPEVSQSAPVSSSGQSAERVSSEPAVSSSAVEVPEAPELFFRNEGVALVREKILEGVWGKNYFGDIKIVDVNIRRLRMKIEEDASNPEYIVTVWGYGYRWSV